MNFGTRLRALIQVRNKHESLIPAGSGGRSSFSGQAATVFGGTGFVGHSLVNNLGRIGSSIVLPIRGNTERPQAQDMRLMGDIGALTFTQDFDMLRWDDQQVFDLIRHSNVVYNVIGNYKDTNIFPRFLTNVEWPERLARLVAAKEDGTRLIHLVHLNCENEDLQEKSGILKEQAEAIHRMREIYPDTIIVKSTNCVGWKDRYTHWWATDGEYYQRSISYIGAFPLIYGGGQNTFVSPVRKQDVARAMTKIGSHPDSPGHDFELFGEKTFRLGELVEYMYDCKWNSMFSMDHPGMRVPGVMNKKDVDLDYFNWDVLGELDADQSELTIFQKARRKVLRLHLAKLNWPRLRPRFLDYIKREQSYYYDWTNEDHFNMMNMSDTPSFKNPGFKELGVVPLCPLPGIHESCVNYLPGMLENFRTFDSVEQPPRHDWEREDKLRLVSTV